MSDNAIAVTAGVFVVACFAAHFAVAAATLIVVAGWPVFGVVGLAAWATGVVACKVWRLVRQDLQR